MQKAVDLIEARLQSFIERSLVSLLPWSNAQNQLAHQLVQAMRDHLSVESDGVYMAPNLYTILVHPSRLASWQANPAYLEELAQTIHQAGSEAGFRFASQPVIHLAPDSNLSAAGIRIHAAVDIDPVSDTAVFELDTPTGQEAVSEIPLNAFLIVNGVRMFALSQPVINMGRRKDNQLVVDDPRVSRVHAQLRAIRGKFILFDLNSTGGTYVNSQRVTRSVLKPGDVISLAGVPIIFGQDVPASAAAAPDQAGSVDLGATSRIQSQSESEENTRKKHE